MIEHVYLRTRIGKDGKKSKRRIYYGVYQLAGDVKPTRISMDTSDKLVAQQKLRDLVKSIERERANVAGVSRAEKGCLNALLSSVLDDCIAELERLRRSHQYTVHISGRVRALMNACKWVYVRDVSAESFRHWRNTCKSSPKTINEYQNALQVLIKWIRKNYHVDFNPLVGVEHIDTRGEKTFERRALSSAEITKLLSVAPPKRFIGYSIALYTGLRRNEINCLEWRDLSLDASPPFLTARASTTKNKRQARLPIHETLARLLLEWKKTVGDESPLVLPDGLPRNHRGLWQDLEKAGISRMEADGRKIDFHALRHTFCTLLQANGVHSRVVQALMRHSSQNLTNNTYTDTTGLPVKEAMQMFPSLGTSKNDGVVNGVQIAFPKGLEVSRVVTGEKNTKVDLPQYLQGFNADCHKVSQKDMTYNLVEVRGVEPLTF